MVSQENRKSPRNPSKQPQNIPENGVNLESSLLSPRFKSVAEMAGWDEEALLLATLVVEDTPERNFRRNNKRSDLHFKTPPTNSRGKRRVRRQSSALIPVTVFNLDDDETSGTNQGEHEKKKAEVESIKKDMPQKVETAEKPEVSASSSCSNSSALPCLDRLREELSCAICLEICFEPSTTPCGHSFCKKCLRSAADKCGKRCPKCRQLISNGRSCTVNTVLWNTIQLLFPKEVQTRKAAEGSSVRESNVQNSERISQSNSNLHVTRRLRHVRSTEGGNNVSSTSSRRGLPNQDNDAALALRLQREEFMDVYRGSSLARENLRAMAQRAINNRVRNRAV